MANIIMVAGKLSITMTGTKTIGVGGVIIPPVGAPIVGSVFITISVVNGVWTASLNGLTSAMKVALDASEEIYIKLVRDTGRKLRMGKLAGRPYLRPSYPNFLGDASLNSTKTFATMLSNYPERAGFSDISAQINADHTNIDISAWANNVIKYAGEIFNTTLNIARQRNYLDFGYWFQHYKFVLSLNRTSVTGGVSDSTPIQANYHYEGGTAGFNTNFDLVSGKIDID